MSSLCAAVICVWMWLLSQWLAAAMLCNEALNHRCPSLHLLLPPMRDKSGSLALSVLFSLLTASAWYLFTLTLFSLVDELLEFLHGDQAGTWTAYTNRIWAPFFHFLLTSPQASEHIPIMHCTLPDSVANGPHSVFFDSECGSYYLLAGLWQRGGCQDQLLWHQCPAILLCVHHL